MVKVTGRFLNFLRGSGAPEVAGGEHAIAHRCDVALQLGIPVETEKRSDLFAALLADGGFLLPRIAEKTLFAGGGNDVRGAAGVECHGQDKGQCPADRLMLPK